jgi:GT2 family glycosyltransferase
MSNAAILICYNTTGFQLELTKQAVESVFAQDVPGGVHLWIVDNGSEIETTRWLKGLQAPEGYGIQKTFYETNQSPVRLVNEMAGSLFEVGYPYILGVPNDVILPANCYSEMLKCPRGVVAAWMTADEIEPIQPPAKIVHEDCHMSVSLTRSWCYKALVESFGSFMDDGYFLYASDVDFKMRLAAVGIHGGQLDILVHHYGSACWRLATPKVAHEINAQADVDRGYFARKWGFGIGSEEHKAAMTDINFRGEPRCE